MSAMGEQFRVMFNFSQWDVSAVDLGVIVGYFVLMMVVGWLCKSISGNISDYIRMGCKSTWWLMGASIFMQAISASTFTGSGAQAYAAGWSFILVGLSGVFGYLMQAIFFAPWLRRTRAITPADAVRQRYGRVVEQIYTYTGTFTGMFWGGSMLLGLAIFMAAVFNVPIPTVILFVGAIVVFYSVSGGSWSVQVTDSLQGLIMVPICLVVTFLSLRSVGGLSGLFDAIEAQQLTGDFRVVKEMGHVYTGALKPPQPGFFTVPWMIASFINSFIISANMTGCWRYLSTKSDGAARKAALFAAVLLFLGGFIWFLPPMVARVQFREDVERLHAVLQEKKTLQAEAKQLDERIAARVTAERRRARSAALARAGASAEVPPMPDAPALAELRARRAELRQRILRLPALANAADGAYAITAKRVLPKGLLGLVIVAMFAATMSSLDSSLTGNAGLITNNIYPALMAALRRPARTGAALLRLTMLVNFLLGGWAIFLALWMQRYLELGEKSLFDLGLEIVLKFQVPMVGAMVLSFFVRRLAWWGPLVGMFVGFFNSILTWQAETIARWFPNYTAINHYTRWYNGMMWHEQMFVSTLLTVLPTLATIRWWPTMSEAYRRQVDVFFRQLHTPVDFRKEVGRDADHTLLKMVGGLGLIMAGAIAVLAFFGRDADGRYNAIDVGAVLFIAVFITAVALPLYLAGRARARRVLAEEAANPPSA